MNKVETVLCRIKNTYYFNVHTLEDIIFIDNTLNYTFKIINLPYEKIKIHNKIMDGTFSFSDTELKLYKTTISNKNYKCLLDTEFTIGIMRRYKRSYEECISKFI